VTAAGVNLVDKKNLSEPPQGNVKNSQEQRVMMISLTVTVCRSQGTRIPGGEKSQAKKKNLQTKGQSLLSVLFAIPRISKHATNWVSQGKEGGDRQG